MLITGIVVSAVVLALRPSVLAQYECARTGLPVVLSGSLVAGDPNQTTAIFRPGPGTGSTCLFNQVPAGSPTPGTFNYDAHVYTNPTAMAGCVTVYVNTPCSLGTGINVVAYSTYNPAAPSTGIIGHLGASPEGMPAYFSFPIAAGASATLVVSEVSAGAGCSSYTLGVQLKTRCHQPHFERDGNLLADYAVFRQGTPSLWFYKSSPDGAAQTRAFGTTGDIPIHGDYVTVDGFDDGISELAVYRPGNNTEYIGYPDSATHFFAIRWGAPGDIPIVGDFDGDGTNDITVFRPSNGNWYIYQGGGTVLVRHWGTSGDTPVTGDFDGDSRADFAVVRSDGTNHRWFVLLSNFNYRRVLTPFGTGEMSELGIGVAWGLDTDKLCPGDYNGDARTDITVWRPSDGTFYTRRFIPGFALSYEQIRWGMSGDIPQPADFDGDNRHDAVIYRPSTNTFWVRSSSTGAATATVFGIPGDQPVSAPYLIQ